MDRRTFLTTAAIAVPVIVSSPALEFYQAQAGSPDAPMQASESRMHWHTPGLQGSKPHYRGPRHLCPFC